MAHFARMNSSHEVKEIVSIDNSKILDPDTGDESEMVGIVKVKLRHPGACAAGGYWKQCSVNTDRGQHKHGGTALRGNYPRVGWFYDSSKDVFHSPRPTDMNGDSCASWVVNSTTGEWDAPITKPTPVVTHTWYEWDESAYQADNTTGWVLLNVESTTPHG